MNPEDLPTVKANVQKLIDKGAPDQDIHDYLEASGYPQQHAPVMPSKVAIAKRNASMPHPEDLESPEPSYAQKALGGIASLNHLIPGAEALQAGARSAVRGQPYTEALSDIQGAESAAPAPVRILNNMTGATIAALAGPRGPWMNPLGKGGTAAVQGARLGAAEGLLSADPASMQDRLLKAGKGGAIASATAGILGDVAPNVARVIRAKSLGSVAMQRGAQMTAADETAYGQSLAHGAGATHPDVTAAFDSPTIRGYANAARKAPSLAGADDATILHETYKRIGERQRALEAQMERAASYKAGPDREIQDLELAKQKLLNAADKIMPGYRKAVEQHANLAGQTDAFQDAADATKRMLNKTSVAGRNLEKNTPEAFKTRIIKLDKEKSAAAREAVLGRVQELAGDNLNKNPLSGWGTNPFGTRTATTTIMKGAPYLRTLDEQINGPASAVSGSFRSPANTGFLRNALAASLGARANDAY